MTGFAEKKYSTKNLSAKVSIKTLNHRFFDWNYRGTPIGGMENRLRTLCQKKIHRGRVEASLELSFTDSSSWDFWVNEDLLQKMVSSFERVSSKIKKEILLSFENILALPHAVEINRRDFTGGEISFLENVFEKTLDEVIKSRQREGRELKREIRGYLQNIRQNLRRIEKLARTHPLLIRKKLEQRLKELNHDPSPSEGKWAEEAAYLAQRYDLTEEVTRLRYHLNHMQALLTSAQKEPAGKKLDFIAQELIREANTINSKAQDIKIINEILTVKSAVEKIRQQVQNIE
jgi:uncharacterized protein (TIGR00255 family)